MAALSQTTARVFLIALAFPAEAAFVAVPMTKFRYVAVCSLEDSVEIAGFYNVRDVSSCSLLCAASMPACQSFVYWKLTSHCSLKDATIANMTQTGCLEHSMRVYGEPTTDFLPRQKNKLQCGGGGCTTSINNFRLCDGGGPGVCDVMQGRLEVYYDGQWGSVCDDQWEYTTSPMAVVTCQMFGYSGGLPQCCAYYNEAPSSYPIWLDEVTCTGNENSLAECSHMPWGSNDCGHIEDVGVICE